MEPMHQATERLTDTANSAKEGLEKSIHQTSERIQDVAQKVKDYGQQIDNHAVEAVGEKLLKGADYVNTQDLDHLTQALKNQLETTVRHHPLTSIGVALTTGYILARLFSRP